MIVGSKEKRNWHKRKHQRKINPNTHTEVKTFNQARFVDLTSKRGGEGEIICAWRSGGVRSWQIIQQVNLDPYKLIVNHWSARSSLTLTFTRVLAYPPPYSIDIPSLCLRVLNFMMSILIYTVCSICCAHHWDL